MRHLGRLGPFLLVLAGCGEPASAPRGEEVWALDFSTHAGEIEASLAPFGVDREAVARRALQCVREYYGGLPVRFRLAAEAGPGESYICVREGGDSTLGRGILDLGNGGIEHTCGLRHGLLFGVFVDAVVDQIEGQGVPVTEERAGRLLGVVLAHEIGHALGLTHTREPYGNGDIMNGAGILDARQREFFFVPEHRELLARNLGAE